MASPVQFASFANGLVLPARKDVGLGPTSMSSTPGSSLGHHFQFMSKRDSPDSNQRDIACFAAWHQSRQSVVTIICHNFFCKAPPVKISGLVRLLASGVWSNAPMSTPVPLDFPSPGLLAPGSRAFQAGGDRLGASGRCFPTRYGCGVRVPRTRRSVPESPGFRAVFASILRRGCVWAGRQR